MHTKYRINWQRFPLVLLTLINIITLSVNISLTTKVVRNTPSEPVVIEEQYQEPLKEEVLLPPPITQEVKPEIPKYLSLGDFEITAYCYTGNPTSTGVMPVEGITIAVDPKVIPYGTIITVNGKEYVAQDCGPAIKGKKLDIYFNTRKQAIEYGRQHHYAYIKKA